MTVVLALCIGSDQPLPFLAFWLLTLPPLSRTVLPPAVLCGGE